jgi:pimeloyl-ACP methyl ester carboxylesterase
MHILDNPLVLSQVFYPRAAPMGRSRHPHAVDATVAVSDDAALGYRLYVHQPDAPLLLYFHGNGEVASDYDGIAPLYAAVGLSLLVVDYRGYGWSTGKPLISKLLPDVDHVLDALGTIKARGEIGQNVPLLVMGRSLGSAPATYCAYSRPELFRGIIIESGYADAPSVFGRLGMLVPPQFMQDTSLPLNNEGKMASITLPLLVIHGENDALIAVTHGQRLYDAAPAADKHILRVPNAGHNDLMMVGQRAYFDAIKALVGRVV